MDDSELDFVDLCSKLLKRNRKKTVDLRQQQQQQKISTQRQQQSSSQGKKKGKKDDNSQSQSCSAVGSTQDVGTGAAPASATSNGCATRAKDKVLLKMQQFKRDSPQRMVLSDQRRPTDSENHSQHLQDQPESQEAECSEPVDSDEALAKRLQQELDKETRPVDLEDEGLFFCQLCNKNLSHMTPEGRRQHINRCLDEKEGHAPPPPPPAGVLECPICGKRFKSQKSRSSHLKRCSSDMGVPPAVLLQALQRQAEETQSTTTVNTQSGSHKRKGSKSNMPASKKPRKKVEDLDEDTMMAMALSSSLLEQEREKARETQAVRKIIIETTAPNMSKSPALKWRPNSGKARSKKKKGGIPRSPPLLLAQDPGAALARIQERVSALLLHSRSPSPPTPSRSPSCLPGLQSAAPLWQKSALLSVVCLTDFYTPELAEYIVPWETTPNIPRSFASGDNPNATAQHVTMETPVTTSRSSIMCAASQTEHHSPTVSTLGTGRLPGCTQALQDLMDLAEDGMTLTQCGYSAMEPTNEHQSSPHHSLNLPSSGFVVEEDEKQTNNRVSGFLPKTMDNVHKEQLSIESEGDAQREKRPSLLLSKLALDLGSMVNNPQLSDVQLQVDTGEVYFAHSFMVYTRCPLLVEMIHESGFGVLEEGVPAAQRVLLSDVPGQAVFVLLQYLYTAHCSFPSSLRPHVLELASRFDLKDLQEFCELQEETMLQTDEHDQRPNTQTDEAFIELLRSMWNDEDSEDDETDQNPFDDTNHVDDPPEDLRLGEEDMKEERVNEDELVEIYKFAATQRRRDESDSVEEEKVDNCDMPEVFSSLTEKDNPKEDCEPDMGSSLDRSYNRLFSQSWGEFKEKDLYTLPGEKLQSQLRISTPQPSVMSARMLLQSSASVIDKMSPSPPPNAPNLPVTGLSPGLPPDKSGHCGRPEETDDILNTNNEIVKSQDAQTRCKLLSSDVSPKRNEPELVVLSDSSDDMNIDLTQCSSSPSPKNTKSFTGIKAQQTIEEIDGQISDSDASLGDCSAEVSWLIPSTPVQPGKSVHASSSQTKSSICRTQLFPKHDLSPPSTPQIPECSTAKDSLHKTTPSKSLISSSGSLDLTRNKKLDSTGFAVPRSPFKHSHLPSLSRSHLNSSKQDTPLPFPAYSSTPVQTDLSKLLQDSRFSADKEVTTQKNSKTTTQSQEKEGVQRFHLSPLSERSSSSSKTNRPYDKSSCFEDCTRGNREETEVANLGNNGEDNAEAEDGESSFGQSFMDEPPMAFNDSWGLDACAENPCFSLELEDSRGSLQKEGSPNFKAATSITRPSTPPDQQSDARTNSFASPNVKSISPGQFKPGDNNSFTDSKIWEDSWEEKEEEDEEKDVAPPLSERLKPAVQHKTPVSNFKKRQALVPITPMPHYSDMDTPDLKNKLNRFGVRPLPKRQMILKLKEIHQYTHQLLSSDSEDGAPSAGQSCQDRPSGAAFRPASCAQTEFKLPTASPSKLSRDDEPLSASQGSNTSSTAESERSNPELVQLSDGDSDSDGGVSASQSASRLQERLQAVRAFILSESTLYSQILQYKPLVLSQFQQQLKAAGIRLGVTKLADYLDSQCITFTTAKPGQSAPSRRRIRKTKAAGDSGVRRKKSTSATH